MVNLTINDQNIMVEEGMTILEAARKENIPIPTLCWHPLVKPFGACRLCIVEIDGGRMVTSCTYPVNDGLEVKTDSSAVVEARRMLIEVLLARAPRARTIQRLAKEYGVEKTGLHITDEGELCILCGLCSRVCDEIVGASAISFANRGVNRQIMFYRQISPELCVGCGVCTAVCPTGCLELDMPGGVISAIAMGRRSAMSIDKYLGGEGIIDEALIEARRPNPWLGSDPLFGDKGRALCAFSPNGFNAERAVEEANRCLGCDLRLQIVSPEMPPELWIEFNEKRLEEVPETEGVFRLFDSEKRVVCIKGTMNLRRELDEQLRGYEKARYFIWEEDPMYSKRESELLQQYMQQHGGVPEGNAGDLDEDLY